MTTATRSKTRKPRRTADDKRAEMEALHEKLNQSVEALRGSEQWAAYLRFCRTRETRRPLSTRTCRRNVNFDLSSNPLNRWGGITPRGARTLRPAWSAERRRPGP